MDLAFFRRGRLWALMLGLVLFGNGFLHLCCHEHLFAASDAPVREPRASAFDASEGHRHSAALTEEAFCPYCSAAFDWFADTASAAEDPECREPVEPVCEPVFLGAAAFADRRSRAPPTA